MIHDLESVIQVHNEKEEFGELGLSLGLRKIEVSNRSATKYEYLIKRDYSEINGIDLSEYNNLEIYIENDEIFTKFTNSTTYITKKGNDASKIIINGVETTLTPTVMKSLNPRLHMEVSNLIIIRDEITNPDLVVYPTPIYEVSADCNMVTVSFGLSKETVKADLDKLAQDYLSAHPDCRLRGGVSTSCIFDEHFCVGTQAYACSGSTCN
ncbi:hypothetical protein GV828_09315 [Flavobacterium sp. NST-5]|uniref:Uncharacterized protein n=1 Tax=Flavobacterium ichthyis TaxID=2698827 RepID=A0ABW9Z947_9FLAO|nr:hypothetical protein [Flavobacterium ichthyis]NBL65395.1 hypothetical protein [Flavobacterium ichthyis]